jgi:HK97 gp10 family phage protein
VANFGIFNLAIDRLRDAAIGVMSRQLQATGGRMVAYARAIVPVDTGELRDSIGATWDASTLTLTLHADAPHAAFVEFGTSRMAAQPYLRPTLAQVPRLWASVAGAGASFPGVSSQYTAGMAAQHGEAGVSFGTGEFE